MKSKVRVRNGTCSDGVIFELLNNIIEVSLLGLSQLGIDF